MSLSNMKTRLVTAGGNYHGRNVEGKLKTLHHFLIALSETLNCFPILTKDFSLIKAFNSSLVIGLDSCAASYLYFLTQSTQRRLLLEIFFPQSIQ